MDELVLRIKSYLSVELHDAEWVSKQRLLTVQKEHKLLPLLEQLAFNQVPTD